MSRPLNHSLCQLLQRLWLLVCAACLLGALLLSAQPTPNPWASWQAAAQRAEAAHLAQLRLQAQRDYTAYVQRTCGPEGWYRTRADGARVCTDKHGRRTGQLLAGANP